MPGFGRPQEIINKDVDSCDLFVGLLWRKWGQSTGVFSSGFEEEFERARKRRVETTSPQMWLLFKKVDTAQLGDPGDQLKLVLTFREKQIASKELLYKEFIDVTDWTQNFYDWLLEHILNLASTRPETIKVPQSAIPSAPVAQPMASEITPSNDATETVIVGQQLLTAINHAAEAISSGYIDNLPKLTEKLDEFQLHRLHLFTTSLNSTLHKNELIGIHELNSLYRYRTDLRTSNLEEFLLFRTVVNDFRAEVCPGWYWFQEMSEGILGMWLFYLASEDANQSVQVGALELLEATMIRPTSDAKFQEYKTVLLTDRSEQVRKAFVGYLKAVGNENDIATLELAINDDDSTVRDEAIKAKLMIIARSNPNDGFSQVLALRNGISKDFLEEFSKFAP